MVETIAPVVHGGKTPSYWTAIVLHTLGATLSASLLGAFLGGLGQMLGGPWGVGGPIALVAIAVLYSARELLGAAIPLPDLDRQVPAWWRSFFSRNVAALLYGVGLGIGFLTYLSFGTYVAVTVGAFLSGDAFVGMLICGAFGLARGIAVALAPGATEEGGPIRLERLAGSGTPKRVNGIALMAIALMALAAAIQ
jgi:hypothetical protein